MILSEQSDPVRHQAESEAKTVAEKVTFSKKKNSK